MRGFTRRQPSVVSKLVTGPVANGRSALGWTYGARLIDSTPAPIASSASPVITARAAWATASRPEPQSRFTVTPGTVLGEAGEEHGHARDVAVVLARLVGAAHVDVLDVRGVDAVRGDELRQHVGGQVVGADAGELPAVAAERRAQRAGDHRLPHARSSA